jgi:hypothetical protein
MIGKWKIVARLLYVLEVVTKKKAETEVGRKTIEMDQESILVG